MNDFIPVCTPFFDDKEERYVSDCVKSGWISSEGKYIKEFEERWAKYCSMNYGVAVSSGTAALYIACKCLHLNKGDEVIMPSFTIISCAAAIIEAGGIPVLVDCDPYTWTMKTEDIKQKITPRTKAIMAVHIYGHPVDMDPIKEIADKHGLFIVEDAAEAHGAEYKRRKCGGLSDISVFSFYANKIVTTGEGGMVLTNRSDFTERARYLRNLCFGNERRFYHLEIGYNYRLTNMQAAVGVAQIEKIEELIKRKRKMADYYNRNLTGLDTLQLPAEMEWAKNVYWMYGVVLSDDIEMNAAEFAVQLKKRGIDTRPFFLGMHEQPALLKMGLFKEEHHPVTERIARKGLYLPSGMTLTEFQQEKVCSAVKEILNQ